MIDLLAVCVWRGNTYDTISVEDPSWEEVIEAISQLNNRERNDLYLHPESEDPEYFLGVYVGVMGNTLFRVWIWTKLPVLGQARRTLELDWSSWLRVGSSRSLKSGSSWI